MVWKGLSREDGHLYAIKIIKPDQITIAVSREIAILQLLNHPNVCRMKEAIREDGPAGSVSEYTIVFAVLFATNTPWKALSSNWLSEATYLITSKPMGH